MFEFAPKPSRIKEKLWMSLCFVFGTVSYGFGQILPYPMVCQLFAVALFTAAVLIMVRYLMRDYVYCVETDADGMDAELVIVETMGKRRTVVCRVAVTDIVGIFSATDVANLKKLKPMKAKGIYRYLSQMKSENSTFLEILDDGKSSFLEIETIPDLIAMLQESKKQFLSDK